MNRIIREELSQEYLSVQVSMQRGGLVIGEGTHQGGSSHSTLRTIDHTPMRETPNTALIRI